jgi:hypothetical protein
VLLVKGVSSTFSMSFFFAPARYAICEMEALRDGVVAYDYVETWRIGIELSRIIVRIGLDLDDCPLVRRVWI